MLVATALLMGFACLVIKACEGDSESFATVVLILVGLFVFFMIVKYGFLVVALTFGLFYGIYRLIKFLISL